MDKTRYDHIPISDKTRAGMTLTSDDIQAITRIFLLQDEVYEDRFDRLEESLSEIKRILKDHEKRIRILEEIIKKLAE